MDDFKRIIGIDLGTTNSAMAVLTMTEPEIITNDVGDRTTPSVVTFTDDDTVLIGKEAQNLAIERPERTVEQVKREMDNEEWEIEVDGETYDPQQISALILEKLVNNAEDYLDEEVDSAVITVPAYFSEKERQATKNAAEIAGLDVEHILSEPSAACLAYGLNKAKQEADEGEMEIAFVYDLGGGTFDATLVDIADDYSLIETLNIDGDSDLGGEDWTSRIVDWICEQIEEDTGVKIKDDPEQFRRVREKALEAKHTLSQSKSTNISLPYVVPKKEYSFNNELTREKFNELTEDLLQDTIDCCDRLFERAEYSKEDVDTVLLVGGSTRMTQCKTALADYFGQDPVKKVNPDEAVAIGAAMQADISETGGESTADILPGDASNVLLTDAVPQTFGVELADKSLDPLIEQDTTFPAVAEDHYTNARDQQEVMNIRVHQGEHYEDANHEDNTYIGNLRLDIQNPKPRRGVDANIAFEIDVDGTLAVEARDEESGEEVRASFEGVFSMTDKEIGDKRNSLPDQEDRQ